MSDITNAINYNLIPQLAMNTNVLSGEQLNSELAYYLSRPTVDRKTPFDVEVWGLFYPSLEVWAKWDARLKEYFKNAPYAGMGKHPSLI